MRFDDIPGQLQVKEQLKKSLETGNISHAYLFSGNGRCGKTAMARVFAAALLCENKGTEPCGQCHSCRMAMTMNHPDIVTLRFTGKTTYKVDDIREQLNSDMAIKPFCSERKIYIIPEAERMKTDCQNALLKTLEEPPPYGIIILVTGNHEILLPTVRSRCVRLDFEPTVSMEYRDLALSMLRNLGSRSLESVMSLIKENVTKPAPQPEDQEEGEGKKSPGKKAAGKKRSAAKEDEEDEEEGEGSGSSKVSLFKLNKDEILDVMLLWYRDVMLYKATSDGALLTFPQEEGAIRSESQRLSYESIHKALDGIQTARERINANLKAENVMESLLLTIRSYS